MEAPDKTIKQSPGNSYVGIRRLYIRDVKEPWFRGDPEIIAYLGQAKGTYWIVRRFYSGRLRGLNDAHTWRTTWFAPNTDDCCSGTQYWCPRNTCCYFDNNFHSKMVVYIYEEDPGDSRSYREKVYFIYPGVSCSWTIKSGDDYIDSGIMYTTNFNYGYDYRHDMGNAYAIWHKVH